MNQLKNRITFNIIDLQGDLFRILANEKQKLKPSYRYTGIGVLGSLVHTWT
jgi:hypothetical protein